MSNPSDAKQSATAQLPGDLQRSRVYAAEDTLVSEMGPRLRTWKSVEAFAESILTSEELNELFPNHPAGISLHRRSRSATASAAVVSRGEIWIRDGSWNALTVIHEISHHLASPDTTHGARFVSIELVLVRTWCGFTAYGELLHAFRTRSVAIDEEFLRAGRNP
ncbi:MAG TPA: hypothetical protein DEG43_14775 [Acidimicrobiaceae bacterium]|nr:hypothetical protein [Acidimicrobiaceae bacterium]